jgi:hypothetical protein
MTSAAKIDANRRNAKFSTGPKSARGRARAAQNARRHGLSVPIAADPKLSAEVQAVVQKIANGKVDPNVRACADRVAQAHIDLNRIRKVKMEMLRVITSGLTPADDIAESASGPGGDLIKSLARLTRYERRTLSRLKSAIREFDNACEQAAP